MSDINESVSDVVKAAAAKHGLSDFHTHILHKYNMYHHKEYRDDKELMDTEAKRLKKENPQTPDDVAGHFDADKGTGRHMANNAKKYLDKTKKNESHAPVINAYVKYIKEHTIK